VTLSAYVTIRNTGSDDVLLGVEAPGLAMTGMLHGQRTNVLGQTTMTMLDSLPLPSGSTLTLAPGDQHVMLEGLMREPEAGERIPLVFRFRQAGRVSVPALAVPPADAQLPRP
jgi:copper(I)-binding protein